MKTKTIIRGKVGRMKNKEKSWFKSWFGFALGWLWLCFGWLWIGFGLLWFWSLIVWLVFSLDLVLERRKMTYSHALKGGVSKETKTW